MRGRSACLEERACEEHTERHLEDKLVHQNVKWYNEEKTAIAATCCAAAHLNL